MESARTTESRRAGSHSGLTWWAAAGFAVGLAAMLGLLLIASATPVDAEVARSGSIGMRWLGGDVAIRAAGILIFVLVTGALLAQSARHSRLLEAREQQRGRARDLHDARDRSAFRQETDLESPGGDGGR